MFNSYYGDRSYGMRRGGYRAGYGLDDTGSFEGRGRGGVGRDDWAGRDRAGRDRRARDGLGLGTRSGRGAGRARRLLDSSELPLVLLKLIADQPRQGSDLVQAIGALTAGRYAPAPRAIYPTITLLLDLSLIAKTDGDAAGSGYAVTAEGTAHIARHAGTIAALLARVTALGQRAGGQAVGQPLRGLRIAIRQRLSAEDSEETRRQLTAILDETARRIEQL